MQVAPDISNQRSSFFALENLELAVAQPAVVDVVGHGRRSELLVEVAGRRVVRAAVTARASWVLRRMVRARHRAVAALPRAAHFRSRSRSEG